MLENLSRLLTSGRLSSQVPLCLIALSTPRSRVWLCPIEGCTMRSLDWWLLREQVPELVCKSNGLLLTIYGSFALWWWIVHYIDTVKLAVLLFSLSCCLAGVAVDFCITNSFPWDHLQIGASSRRQQPLFLFQGKLWVSAALFVPAVLEPHAAYEAYVSWGSRGAR